MSTLTNSQLAAGAAQDLFSQYTNLVIASWAKDKIYAEILTALELGSPLEQATRIGENWLQQNCRAAHGSF